MPLPTPPPPAASTPGLPAAEAAPWWRFGIVWFALSGPALVVVAAFVTMAIAFSHADVVLTEATTPGDAARAGATAPALQARNHAATPAR